MKLRLMRRLHIPTSRADSRLHSALERNGKAMGTEIKLLNTGITDLLIVDDLPHGARSFDIELNEALELYQLYWLADFMGIRDVRQCRDLPEGYKYTVLGRASELTEEQCLPLVKEPYQGCYFDYRQDFYYWKTAKESFFSCIEHMTGILLENPLGKKPYETFNHPDWEYKRAKWQEAQSKVSNPLILKAEKV